MVRGVYYTRRTTRQVLFVGGWVMGKWPGLGDRIRERIVALGFTTKDGSADVQRFALAKGYLPNYLYRWGTDTTPDRDNLLRLAKDLECSPAWLLFGVEVKLPRVRNGARFLGIILFALTSTAGGLALPWHPTDGIQPIISRGIMSTRFGRWLRRLPPTPALVTAL